jgi:hypothetical protein
MSLAGVRTLLRALCCTRYACYRDPDDHWTRGRVEIRLETPFASPSLLRRRQRARIDKRLDSSINAIYRNLIESCLPLLGRNTKCDFKNGCVTHNFLNHYRFCDFNLAVGWERMMSTDNFFFRQNNGVSSVYCCNSRLGHCLAGEGARKCKAQQQLFHMQNN